ncbi:hypothetical protein NIES25_12460 [Nostoc linckia NIES-25]|nr:hypothetical protein NIES25_12460 [Nostoc linckia NIES-25]
MKVDLLKMKVDLLRVKVDLLRVKVDLLRVNVDLLKMNVDLLKMNVDLLRVKVDLLKLKVDLLKLKVDLLKMNVDLLRVKVDLLRMNVEVLTLFHLPISPSPHLPIPASPRPRVPASLPLPKPAPILPPSWCKRASLQVNYLEYLLLYSLKLAQVPHSLANFYLHLMAHELQSTFYLGGQCVQLSVLHPIDDQMQQFLGQYYLYYQPAGVQVLWLLTVLSPVISQHQ